MRLRIKKHFDVHHPLLPRSGKVRLGKLGKVLLGAQHLHGGVVQSEKRLQVGELIGLAERLNRRIAECHLVAFGKPKEVPARASLLYEVQLCFRQLANKRFQSLRHNAILS